MEGQDDTQFSPPPVVDGGQPEAAASKPTGAEKRFPCEQCGAQLLYAPGTTSLKCQYCGHVTPIPQSAEEIKELDFHEFLDQGRLNLAMETAKVVKCQACGAEFTVDPNRQTSSCPFCGSNVIVPTDPEARISPASLLPFKFGAKEGRECYRKWIGSRFWAPNDLKRMSLMEGGLSGMYIPYWTYDSETTTWYTGMRGEHYYETETYTDSNGNEQTRTVQKTHWYPASGVVWVAFDDILVLASNKVPHKYAQNLGTWDLPELTGYQDAFITGYQTMRYDVDLEQGFGAAQNLMQPTIDQNIRWDIGGDEQQILSKKTQYDNITFKHILLPIWVGAYRYRGKTWNYLVNGRSGEVRGEAPVSFWKVLIAVILGLLIIGVGLWLYSKSKH